MNERELDLLFEQVQQHQELIYEYAETLSETYHDEIRSMFLSEISREVQTARNRVMYSSVCQHISVFAKSGYPQEAADLITEYKTKYKRLSAFVDELSKFPNNH